MCDLESHPSTWIFELVGTSSADAQIVTSTLLEQIGVRYGDATLFFECVTNKNVRLRYMKPEFERLAHVKYEDKGPKMSAKFAHGKVLKTFRYGPYLIVMNASEEESFNYEVPEDMRDKQAVELHTGRKVILDRRAEIAPASSRAFVVKK